MEELVGTKLAWKPSGASADSVFSVWASAPKETPFPALTEATTMNCWEAIFLAAHRSGVLSWQWIHDLYTKGRPLNEWVNAMTAGARQRYKPYARGTPAPARGDLVFMDGTAHIMLATGRVSPNGTEVLSFWPPPDAPIMTDLKGVPTASPDRVKVTTIEEVVMWWTHGLLDQVVVEFGRPAWY
jgi:hypothetical protein